MIFSKNIPDRQHDRKAPPRGPDQPHSPEVGSILRAVDQFVRAGNFNKASDALAKAHQIAPRNMYVIAMEEHLDDIVREQSTSPTTSVVSERSVPSKTVAGEQSQDKKVTANAREPGGSKISGSGERTQGSDATRTPKTLPTGPPRRSPVSASAPPPEGTDKGTGATSRTGDETAKNKKTMAPAPTPSAHSF